MKKLLTAIFVGGMASSALAFIQCDFPANLLPAGQVVDHCEMQTLSGVVYPATFIGYSFGAFNCLFNYDDAYDANEAWVIYDEDEEDFVGDDARIVRVRSGECEWQWTTSTSQSWQYMSGPAGQLRTWGYNRANTAANGTFIPAANPFTEDCYGPSCVPGVTVLPTALDFGTVGVMGAVTRTFEVCNTSVGDCPPIPFTLTTDCPATFAVSPMAFDLATDACQLVTVTFNGQHLGETTCMIQTGYGDVTVTVIDLVAAEEVPAVFSLSQAYPNPFNPTTSIAFSVPETEEATLRVFNTSGQLVQTLVNGTVERGEHKVVFDASALASGVYVYQLETKTQSAIQKMVLVK